MNSTENNIRQLLTRLSKDLKSDGWQRIEMELGAQDPKSPEKISRPRRMYPYALTACAVVLAAVAAAYGSNPQRQLSYAAASGGQGTGGPSSSGGAFLAAAGDSEITFSQKSSSHSESRDSQALNSGTEHPETAWNQPDSSAVPPPVPSESDPAAGHGGAGVAEFPFYTYNHRIYSGGTAVLSTDEIGKQLAADRLGDGLIFEIKGTDPSKSVAVGRNGYKKYDSLMDDSFSWNGSVYAIENPNSTLSDPIGDRIGEIDSRPIYSIKGVDSSQRIRVRMEGELYADAVRQ